MTTEILRHTESQGPIDTFYHPAVTRIEAIANLSTILERKQFTSEDMFKAIADISSVLSIEEDLKDGLVEDPTFPFELPDVSWQQGDYLDGSEHFAYLGNGGPWIEFGLDKNVDGEDGPRSEVAWFQVENDIDDEQIRTTSVIFSRDEKGNISVTRVIADRDADPGRQILADGVVVEDEDAKQESYEMPTEEKERMLGAMMSFYQEIPLPESLVDDYSSTS